MAHTLTVTPRVQAGLYLSEPPSAARIAAYSGVIAIHAAALLLLLMPMAAPVPRAVDIDVIPIFETFRPRPPIEVPVTPPRHETPRQQPRRIAEVQPRNEAPPDAPVLVEQGEQAPPDTGNTGDIGPDVVEPPAVAAVRLEYANAPAPTYPREALRRRIEGTVLLQVLVGVDGRPLDVIVQQSSGNRALDEAARLQVLKRWRFRPAMQDGIAIQAMGLVPVVFKLQ